MNLSEGVSMIMIVSASMIVIVSASMIVIVSVSMIMIVRAGQMVNRDSSGENPGRRRCFAILFEYLSVILC